MHGWLDWTLLLALTASTIADNFESLQPGPENPFCDPTLCAAGTQHVACNSYRHNWHSSCLPERTRMVSLLEYKDLIVMHHNERRNLVASGRNPMLPRAARMMVISWSDELAQLASYNARMCLAMYDECSSSRRFPRSGQNIIVFNMTRLREDEVLAQLYPKLIVNGLRLWWREHYSMTAAEMELYVCNEQMQFNRNFAVMALEGNSHVGCAAVRYVLDDITFFKLTCNYARNVQCGQPIYNFRAVGCSSGPNQRFSALCSKKEIYA